ncbi:MAG: TonB-dependent receptor [Bacteroidales bacterium]|nr:TonB-dependent receptor [Bacteroidales bacterium]
MNRIKVFLILIILGYLPSILAQSINVSGKITDASTGELLPGVNIIINGTTTGTISDINGAYSLEVPLEDAELAFSSIGYITKIIAVNGHSVINVELELDVKTIDEVVVLGYGSMERTNVTGAISSVKTEEISKVPVPNVVEAMRGQVPGLRMTRTDGMPGSGVNFYIRGRNSLKSDEEPLIVIDGIPQTGGNIAEINTDDIESINILKDAGAASIYGTSGANGVILIATKGGKSGKPELKVNISRGYTDLVQKPDLMNAREFVQLKMDAAEGAGRPHELEDVLTDGVEYANYTDSAGIKEIDWHDVLLRIGKITNASISLAGGNDKITFYMNGDVYQEDGIVQHTSYDRYSFRFNSEYNPYKVLKMGAKVQLVKTISDETGNSAVLYNDAPDFTDFLGNTPLGRLYDENNELVPTVKGDQFDYNPLWKYRESQTDRSVGRIALSPYMEITFFEGFTYRINASVEQRTESYGRFTSGLYDLSTVDGTPGNNKSIMFDTTDISYLLDHILTYKKLLADKHMINATLVYGFQTWNGELKRLDGQGSITDLLSYYAVNTSQSDVFLPNYDYDEWRKLYYVGRLGYSYDRRYNITGTIRRDGSSIFGPKHRWGWFPSVSFAWNIDEESFLDNLTMLNNLKYRISWGRMGNDRIGTYKYVALTDPVSYPFGGTSYTGYTADKLANEYLHWETSQQFNTGLDFGLFNNRLFGSFDIYKTNTIDLILDQLIPSVTGFKSIVSNIGETENMGMELIVSYRVLNGDFKWDVSANWARDRNKIVRLNDAKDAEGKLLNDEANGWFIGQDIDVIYNFDYLGVYQLGDSAIAASRHPDKRNYGVGDPKIRDVDGNDTINFKDQTFLGSPTPDWYGGLRNTFSYKGFELTILFEAVKGVTRINYIYGALTGRGNEVNVDYWTPRNPTNEFPQPNIREPYYYQDAVRVRDASFIALRNVSLSYTLPNALTQKIKVSGLTVYVRGNNLKYFTKFEGYSPETNIGAFPITKVWTIGTSITF